MARTWSSRSALRWRKEALGLHKDFQLSPPWASLSPLTHTVYPRPSPLSPNGDTLDTFWNGDESPQGVGWMILCTAITFSLALTVSSLFEVHVKLVECLSQKCTSKSLWLPNQYPVHLDLASSTYCTTHSLLYTFPWLSNEQMSKRDD